jgi:hypothetical protein
MYPVMGWLFMVVFFALCVALAKVFSTLERAIPYVLYALFVTQLLMTPFYVISPKAYLAFQLMVTACFSMYAVLTDHPHNIRLAAVFTLFNFFCLMGKVALLGYVDPITGDLENFPSMCASWFGVDPTNRCVRACVREREREREIERDRER